MMTEETLMRKIFERTVDSQKVIDVLRGVNDFIKYEDLAERAGLSKKRLTQVMYSARNSLFNETAIEFDCVWGLGLQRMTDSDKAQKAKKHRKSIKRKARKAVRSLGTIQMDQISKSEQNMVVIEMTTFNAMLMHAAVNPEPNFRSPKAPTPKTDSADLAEVYRK